MSQSKQQVAGWLALLTLILLALAPALTALATITTIIGRKPTSQSADALDAWAVFKNVAWGFWLAKSALWISAGYQLRYRFEPLSPRYATVALLIAGPVFSFAQMQAVRTLARADFSVEGMSSLVLSAVWAAIWIVYLARAHQVRLLYFSDKS